MIARCIASFTCSSIEEPISGISGDQEANSIDVNEFWSTVIPAADVAVVVEMVVLGVEDASCTTADICYFSNS